MWLSSALLTDAGFGKHGFSTRAGGVSPAPYDSWNFSPSTGDTWDNVKANFRILAESLEVEADQLRSVHQVHSARVVVLEESTQQTQRERADALLCLCPGLVVGVKTADCVPVLMADPASGAVAAIHAGWRGVVAGIVPKTLEALRGFHPQAQPLFAIGPHIRAAHFQVGPEVAEQFPSFHRPDPSTKDRFLVDLDAAIRAQLHDCAIPAASIESIRVCTISDPDKRFFSHRASGGTCGRMFNFIKARSLA